MTDPIDLVVYKDWPEDVVRRELETFRDVMFDGAGIEELRAGLRGVDFLTRKSTMSETTAAWVDALTNEARMRIELLQIKEDLDKDDAQKLAEVQKGLQALNQGIRAIQKRFIHNPSLTREEVRDHVTRRTQARIDGNHRR